MRNGEDMADILYKILEILDIQTDPLFCRERECRLPGSRASPVASQWSDSQEVSLLRAWMSSFLVHKLHWLFGKDVLQSTASTSVAHGKG